MTQQPDFANAKVGDWYEGVGEIATEYEARFVRRYGKPPTPSADALEDTLTFLKNFFRENQCDGSCPFGSMNEGTCHDYDSCDPCILDHAIAALRQREGLQ